MTAPKNVHHVTLSHNSLVPRHGVVTLFGYGIQARVDRGHLLLADGIGAERRHFRLPRVGHGLRRLIVIGSDGMISLASLRWLADQGAAFVMLERNGKVLATTGPVRPSDAKLRRAQALAAHSGADVKIARELISRKLAGQEQVAREILRDPATADEINRFREFLPNAERLDLIRSIESQAAAAYWGSWRNVPVIFPAKDLPRVPEHWRSFGTRKSLLTGSPRLACNAPNAALNFLYSILESESTLAAAALGLDSGLGVLHADTGARASLSLDLMEAIRPQVDRYVLTWLLSRPLRREWFFEQRDGNCRLMALFASRLAETAQVWARAVGPVAEMVARELWLTTRKRTHSDFPPTRLTQQNKRQRGGQAISLVPAPAPESVCSGCGKTVAKGSTHCSVCVVEVARERMLGVARKGRLASKSAESRLRLSTTQRRQALAWRRWESSSKPEWLTEAVYEDKIKPSLLQSSISQIAAALRVSTPYAANIRLGRRRPHQRHWLVLAKLAGFPGPIPPTDSRVSVDEAAE